MSRGHLRVHRELLWCLLAVVVASCGSPSPRRPLPGAGGPRVCAPGTEIITRPAAMAVYADRRVAQAGSGPSLNARMTVRCLQGKRMVRRWAGPAQWNGELPATIVGELRGGKIFWIHGEADECAIRVDISNDNPGGWGLAEFCGWSSDRLEIIVTRDSGGLGDGAGDDPDGASRRGNDGYGQPGATRAKDGKTGRTRVADVDGTTRPAGVTWDGGATGRGQGTGAAKRSGQVGGSDRGKPGGDLAEDGGVDGEFSRITGEKFGAEHGAIGGEGDHGDFGVRGGGAIIGWVNVPTSLRPLAETLIILEDAVPSDLAATWVKKRIGKQAVLAIRNQLRRESRDFAKQVLADNAALLNRALRKFSPEQRVRMARMLEWELQRRYFQRVEDGASALIANLERRLRRKMPKHARAAAQENLAKSKKLLEAARVKPIAGRLPVNHRYAGKAVPADRLPKKYRKKGLRFTDDGYPDFGPYAQKLPNGQKNVKIKPSGNHDMDKLAANKAAGFNPPRTPDGYTWHHHQDGTIMSMVPKDLHQSVRHTGGMAHYRHATGDTTAYAQASQ